MLQGMRMGLVCACPWRIIKQNFEHCGVYTEVEVADFCSSHDICHLPICAVRLVIIHCPQSWYEAHAGFILIDILGLFLRDVNQPFPIICPLRGTLPLPGPKQMVLAILLGSSALPFPPTFVAVGTDCAKAYRRRRDNTCSNYTYLRPI
jgi:hypothetical protein